MKEIHGTKFNDLSHDELITLATCYSEGQVTNYMLQITIDKHSADITKLLKGLCDNNLLISYGVGRGTKYKINEDYLSYNTNNTSNDTSNGTSRRTRKSIDTLRIEILEVICK